MLFVENKDLRLENIKKINSVCLENETSVFVLGATHTGRVIAKYLVDNGVTAPIVYVVDDAYITEDQINAGIIPFSEYLKDYSLNSPLVFGFYNYDIILKKYDQLKDTVSYMFDFHITVVNDERVEWNFDYYQDNMDRYVETYNMLYDDKSKDVMQAFLDAAISGKFHALFSEHVDRIPYFNDKLSSFRIDRLFDCGAFDGDSAHDFVAQIPDYEKIIEFEPDSSNVEKINERVKKEKIRDLEIVEKGVWSKSTTLYFRSEGKSSSAVSSEGDVSIDVICLDDMFEQFTPNSLIKMDIEGSELEALKGAEKVIREISPALAICVYHKREDLITIPQYIASLVPDGTYNYYLGYQGLDLAELVFYAVPRERK